MIYIRTAKGQAEIESASRVLPQRLRMILLLIDGKRSDVELRTLLPTATPGTLSELQALGYIGAAVTVATATPRRGTIAAIGLPNSAFPPSPSRLPASPQRTKPATQAVDSLHLESRFKASQMPSRFDAPSRHDDDAANVQQRDQIARSLERALGPTAANLVQRVRLASTVRELKDAMQSAQQAITQARGSDMADEFASRYGNLEAL